MLGNRLPFKAADATGILGLLHGSHALNNWFSVHWMHGSIPPRLEVKPESVEIVAFSLISQSLEIVAFSLILQSLHDT